MRKLGSEAEKIMIERFGKDTVIALATVEHEVPYVRNVNAYYEDGSFYIITYALSNKIKQIEKIQMLRQRVTGLPHTEGVTIQDILEKKKIV